MASNASQSLTIERLSERPWVGSLGPIAARFVYALRLIAVHDRAQRDPVPELATRLGGLETAAKALALAQTVKAVWPENIHVSRHCCRFMSHDEATIGRMIEHALHRDRPGFEAELAGLIRPGRIAALWDGALALVAAELGARAR